jgi:Fe-S cluster assembly iron-binding protein IscA
MGLVLDEPTANDEKIEVQGVSLIMVSEVANAIRAYGGLVIDYRNNWWNRGFQLSLSGQGSC